MIKNHNNKINLPQTRTEYIYNTLKESILRNELKADQKINEKRLAEFFKVSKTPVREAIRTLAAEGFVKTNAHREARVAEVSYNELKNIFQVLGTLDSLAIELAVNKMTSRDINKLEDLIEKMKKKCGVKSVEEYLELNVAFHNKIWTCVPNELLQELLYLIRDRMLRYTYARVLAMKDPADLEKSIKQHIELVNLLKQKNKEKLKDLIYRHRIAFIESSAFKKDVKKYLMSKKGI
jgi:DNA-binding GntR family transcriptional regulator